MEIISSKDNEFIKHIRKLKDKKEREESKQFVVEGIKIIEEAIAENANIANIVICEDCEKNDVIPRELIAKIEKYDVKYVSSYVFESLKTVVSTQGILAVINMDKKDQEVKYEDDIIVCLDNIQDPGNLGTIIRTLDSVGVHQIVMSKDTADVYNPKVVRSTMGAIFRITMIYATEMGEQIKKMQENKYQVVITSLDAKKTIYDIDYSKKVIVIGNEANGVSKEIQDLANEKVIIPMLGKTESLNASVAAGIVMYEYVRQQIKK